VKLRRALVHIQQLFVSGSKCYNAPQKIKITVIHAVPVPFRADPRKGRCLTIFDAGTGEVFESRRSEVENYSKIDNRGRAAMGCDATDGTESESSRVASEAAGQPEPPL
jgi:hypothetical protein